MSNLALETVAVLRGAKGATAPGPALLVTQKGPRTGEKIEKKSQEKILIYPCGSKIYEKNLKNNLG